MPVRPAAILIAGPTGSGKSALALRLAEALGGIVVNADSMQVYRDLRILTARPSTADEARAPHRLYGHVDGAENFSVGRWAADAATLLAEIRDAGRLPIVVGGTGLYFKALTEGLSDLPEVPVEVRAAVRSAAEGRGTVELHAELAVRDPETAVRLRPSDRLRVLRALEVLQATGSPLARLQAKRRPGPLAGAAPASVFLSPDRAALRQAIDRRFEAMMAAGALDEVRALAARGLDPALPIMRAHGVPGPPGPPSRRDDVGRGGGARQADTRAYVKRQFTWFRHQMPAFRAVPPEEAEAAIQATVASGF